MLYRNQPRRRGASAGSIDGAVQAFAENGHVSDVLAGGFRIGSIMLVLKSQWPIEVCTMARTFCNTAETEESPRGIACDAAYGDSLAIWSKSEESVAWVKV